MRVARMIEIVKQGRDQQAAHLPRRQLVFVKPARLIAQPGDVGHVPEVMVGVGQIAGIEEQDAKVIDEVAVVEALVIADNARQVAGYFNVRHWASPRRRERGRGVAIAAPALVRHGCRIDSARCQGYSFSSTCASRNQSALSRARENAVNKSAVSASPAPSVSSIAARTELPTAA